MKRTVDFSEYRDLVPAAELARKLGPVPKRTRSPRIDVDRLRRATIHQKPAPYGIVEKMRDDDRF